MDLFGVSLARRRLFLAVPTCSTPYEPSKILNVPSSLVFQYFTHKGLSASAELFNTHGAYALAEFVVWTLIFFLDIARAGVRYH